jgi:phosphatidylserine/phosphatidylglycerophosphate/cardiolipin synthase-like enzyme
MKHLVILFCFAIFALISCGLSLESENENWKKNLEAANNLKAEYAVFKPLIDKKIEEATKLWDEAAKISNEDQKLKKMLAANDLLDAGCLANLMNMKDKISDLKSKKESLMQLKTPDDQLESRAQRAFETVEDAIKKAEKTLYMTQADFNIDEASAKIDRAWGGLNDAYKEVEIIIDNINKENNAITQDKQQKDSQVKQEKQKVEEAAKDIKCPYCGTLNPHNYSKCKSCGAPKE